MSAPERYLRWNGRSPRGKTLPLLWPVLVWTVLAPQASLRLNVFQQAILGLLHAGQTLDTRVRHASFGRITLSRLRYGADIRQSTPSGCETDRIPELGIPSGVRAGFGACDLIKAALKDGGPAPLGVYRCPGITSPCVAATGRVTPSRSGCAIAPASRRPASGCRYAPGAIA